MNSCTERLKNGIITENPTFVMMLGMCPTLAVTSSAINGLGMGLTTTAVLILSNVFISLLRKVIPDKVRIPAFIVIVATFVTLIQLLLQAYLPSLNKALGVYIPLIVVNCIILGRAEAYASKNPVLPSAFDGSGRIICDHNIINAGQQRRIKPVPWYLSISRRIQKGGDSRGHGSRCYICNYDCISNNISDLLFYIRANRSCISGDDRIYPDHCSTGSVY